MEPMTALSWAVAIALFVVGAVALVIDGINTSRAAKHSEKQDALSQELRKHRNEW